MSISWAVQSFFPAAGLMMNTCFMAPCPSLCDLYLAYREKSPQMAALMW